MSKHQLFQATKAEATVKEKWYLVDKDAFGKFASNSQNAQLTGLDAQEVSQKLEAGHAQMLRQFSSVLPVAMIIPKGDTSIISDKEKVGRLELKSGAQYIEGMKLYSEMVSCKLDVGQKGSLNHMTTALTIALGSDTVGSLAQGKQLLCVIAPSIGSRQLVITHSFEEKVPRR